MSLSIIAEHHDPPSAPPHPMAPFWVEAVQSTYIHGDRAQAYTVMLGLQAYFESDHQFDPDVAQRLSAMVKEAFLACADVVAFRVVDREHYAA